MNIEITGTVDDRTRALVDLINKLSPDAMFLAGLHNFGIVMSGKAILLAPRNEKQKDLFRELMEVGFCHGDVERGIYGYRSTYQGREACGIIRAAYNLKDGILG